MYSRDYENMTQKILFEYLDKVPKAPTRMIARILVRDQPDFFDNLEKARKRIAYYRGANGTKDRKYCKTKKYMKDADI